MSTGRKRKISAKKRDSSTLHDGNGDGGPSTPTRVIGCDKRSCTEFNADPPYCFCKASQKCANSGNSSRWYHLSIGQHYCNECFEYFYRSGKDGNKLFQQWKSIWDQESGGHELPPRIAQLMADMWLPVYVQCIEKGCGRWRKLPAHIELHHVKLDVVKCVDCNDPEDQCVVSAKHPLWVHSIAYTPLLRYNEGLSSLLCDYFPEGVGLSPATVTQQRKKSNNTEEDIGAHSSCYDDLHPFNNPNEGSRACAFTPDVMEDIEIKTFPEWTKSPALEVYLILRNIILSVWYSNVTQCVTVEECMKVLSLRGVVRVWCAQQLPRILHFMSRRGFVNHGVLNNAPLVNQHQPNKKNSVIIVGAGPAGVSATRHLYNFGYNVTLLEASNRIGGRVFDDYSVRGCGLVPMGAMFVTGTSNNPLTVLAKQTRANLIPIEEDNCELMFERGVVTPIEMDKRVEQHYNQTLDSIYEWRETVTNDAPLSDKLTEFHLSLLSGCGLSYSKEECSLLDFHYGNLEFACGATLDKVSARYWDHNDSFDQFQGPHSMVSFGLMKLLSSVVSNIVDVRYNHCVVSIERTVDGVMNVKCANGVQYSADKVIVTVPLSLLKEQSISFTPDLSPTKITAISNLGAGVVEKVAICFSSPFWRSKQRGSIPDVDSNYMFGHISSDSNSRGLFGLFYDISNTYANPTESSYLLMATISGLAVDYYNKLEDDEIIKQCLRTLELLFPEQCPLPAVLGYSLSHWSREPYAKMSYSYVSVGSNGSDYNILSEEEMGGSLHFAGEATNRHHPQGVTGAYLSGIREAAKIIENDYYTDIRGDRVKQI